ncbi:hypothetical protein O4H52_00895 [Sphingomonadaceae bacterium G21617-S1]|nr:hypothetical protein [Sphingomonadaceae bacterium G21617-S1]
MGAQSIGKPAQGYPGRVAIRRAVETARALGLDVAGFEVSPDGTIRVIDARIEQAKPQSLFDQLEAAGKI